MLFYATRKFRSHKFSFKVDFLIRN